MKSNLLIAAIFLFALGLQRAATKLDEKTRQAVLKLTPSDPPAAVHTNLPPGFTLRCDDEGHYLPLIEGQFAFTFEPVYTNRQDALERAWRYFDTKEKPAPERNLRDYNWKDCE
jgi:hypothetical protein